MIEVASVRALSHQIIIFVLRHHDDISTLLTSDNDCLKVIIGNIAIILKILSCVGIINGSHALKFCRCHTKCS